MLSQIKSDHVKSYQNLLCQIKSD